MSRPSPAPRSLRLVFHEVGWSGILAILALIFLLMVVFILFATLRPPTVAEVERDIWVDWARLATDEQGRTIIDQLLENRQAAGKQLVESLGRLIDSSGDRFVVRTDVRFIRIRNDQDQIFAEWSSGNAESIGPAWRDLNIDLIDDQYGKVGSLEVGYKFYGQGLESLPNLRRLESLYRFAVWLVVLLTVVLFSAFAANILRIRERARRLQSQQVTLDLARQMCHELRNGLWSFSLEGRNLQQLFDRVEEYFSQDPALVAQAMDRVGFDEKKRRQFCATLEKERIRAQIDPNTDVMPINTMAREAYRHIESFSRYINLTVEELDRNLLGSEDTGWTPTPVRVIDAWHEACQLLAMRLRSGGVQTKEEILTEDDRLVADRRALVHVFVNLIKNAVEAMRSEPPPRIIHFRLTAGTAAIVCELTNEGPAILPEHLPHLFEKGFSTKTGAGRGTGLALVSESIRQMGGTISVTSDSQSGTVFRIQLPLPISRITSEEESLPPSPNADENT